MDLAALLQSATDAALAAGELIRADYRSVYDSWDKSPDNPVTEVDLAADRLLRERLGAAAPQYGWLSEETRDTPDRLQRRCVWVVDPLDGTKEFIQGIDQFAVSIACLDGLQPMLGVVHNPATGETFSVMSGESVHLNRESAPAMLSRREADGARVLVSNSEVARGKWAPFEQDFALEPVGSSAYKLAKVAVGGGDAYISLNPKNEWDICAGVALIQAAGGRVTDLDGRPFRFNQPQTKVNGLVASNPLLHAALLERVRRRRA